MRFAFLLSFAATFVNAQKLSFHLKGPNEDFDGQRGELGESLVKFEIDERLWNASSESVYTISISKKVFASVPLGLLRKNGFNDEIVVHRDQDGNIYHIDYSVVPTALDARPTHFTTTLKTNLVIEAVRPLLKKSVIIQPGAEKIETKSFLQQYWMYLVPVVLFLLLAPPEEPPKKAKKN